MMSRLSPVQMVLSAKLGAGIGRTLSFGGMVVVRSFCHQRGRRADLMIGQGYRGASLIVRHAPSVNRAAAANPRLSDPRTAALRIVWNRIKVPGHYLRRLLVQDMQPVTPEWPLRAGEHPNPSRAAIFLVDDGCPPLTPLEVDYSIHPQQHIWTNFYPAFPCSTPMPLSMGRWDRLSPTP